MLWVVFLVVDARALEQDGIITGTLVVDAVMATLALVAAWASFRPAPLVLVVVSAVSFLPVGLYVLLSPGYFSWIGVCNLLCLAAGMLIAVCVRFPGAAGWGALR